MKNQHLLFILFVFFLIQEVPFSAALNIACVPLDDTTIPFIQILFWLLYIKQIIYSLFSISLFWKCD